MRYLSIFVGVFVASAAAGAKLPSSFAKCDWTNSECLKKSVQSAIRALNKPHKEVNLPNLHPLEIPSLAIGAGTGPVAFQQNYQNMKVTGYDKIECSKVEFNSANATMVLDCVVPKLDMNFHYEINGRILVLPIRGKGPGLISLHKLRSVLVMKLEEYEKRGAKHYKVASRRLFLEPEFMNIKLENLFDGDKALGDGVNQVMNDNWKEVFADVKSSYEDAFGTIYQSIFDGFGAKVAISDLASN